MLVIGVGLVFAGYAVGFWAYCGIRGYNVTLPQVFSPKGPPGGQQAKQDQQAKPASKPPAGTATTRGGRPVRGAF